MAYEKPSSNSHILEQLLRRGDVWRGQSQRLTPLPSLDTGHGLLNQSLVNQGWPLATLVEVCQPRACGYSEWLLLAPALRRMREGYIVILNPPGVPFAAGLIQLGLDLDRLVIIQAQNKAEFLASFVELAKSDICASLLAWQPKQNLSYTELRKCLLAAADGQGFYVLFSPAHLRRQSSPAALRLAVQLSAQALHVDIFKQKGALAKHGAQTVSLALPETWMPLVSPESLEENTRPSPMPGRRKGHP